MPSASSLSTRVRSPNCLGTSNWRIGDPDSTESSVESFCGKLDPTGKLQCPQKAQAAVFGIQVNGAGVHRRYTVWQHDQVQASDLAAAGWRIIQVTWSQLEESEVAVCNE
jgi:hypothetical protein